MTLALNNNRVGLAGAAEQTITGAPGDTGIPLIGRIFIDIGIAIGTVLAGIVTGGTALPEIGGILGTILPSTVEGAAGLTTALVANTTIDVSEGNTDILTLGLDIGLPFATELLSAGVGSILKKVPLGLERATGYYERSLIKAGLNTKYIDSFTSAYKRLVTNTGRSTSISGIELSARNYVKTMTRIVAQPTLGPTGDLTRSIIHNLEQTADSIGNWTRYLTDIFDRVTDTVKQAILRVLPQLSKLLKTFKAMLKQLKRALSIALNPVSELISAVNKKIKPMIKRIIPEESKLRLKLATIKQRAELRKQSILQNALIAQNNIQTVESRWILGYSVIAKDLDDEGNIELGHLVIWFIPETTYHNGQRGAVPEPYSKKPVTMLNLSGDEIRDVVNTTDWGSFYRDNVSDGKANTTLGDGEHITQGQSGANFLAQLFKGSLSIIPGYSLYTDIKGSIAQAQGFMDKIVSGTLGSDYTKQLTNYTNTLHQLGSAYIPKSAKSAAHIVQDAQGGEFAALLKPAQAQANSWAASVDKRGSIRHVKNI